MSIIRNTDAPTLIDLDGNVFNLSELNSEQTNLILFYNTSCLGCTGRAIPYGYELSQNNKDLKLIVIHVSLGSRKEDVDEIKSVFTVGEPPFPVYRDLDNRLYEDFNCEGTPHWIITNNKGEVFYSIFGSQEGAKLKIELALTELLPKFS